MCGRFLCFFSLVSFFCIVFMILVFTHNNLSHSYLSHSYLSHSYLSHNYLWLKMGENLWFLGKNARKRAFFCCFCAQVGNWKWAKTFDFVGCFCAQVGTKMEISCWPHVFAQRIFIWQTTLLKIFAWGPVFFLPSLADISSAKNIFVRFLPEKYYL